MLRAFAVASFLFVVGVIVIACGSDAIQVVNYGQPVDASFFTTEASVDAAPTPPIPVPPAGVFDWRDAVIYFVFVDRFFRSATSTNPQCNVAGSQATPSGLSSTNYLGGDWAGVTEKINANYFNDLGVNVLWITVPLKNADTVVGEGSGDLDNAGTIPDTHEYSAYHGYWPLDPTATEDCFGTAADLQALVTAAHAKNLKVLFDYAMVHVHTSSPIYTAHVNDTPSWFTKQCVCAQNGCPNYDTTCWFTTYLAHYDYTNPAARDFSVNAAVQLIKTNGNDAFRLDAIKQVDPSWLAALRPAITSQIIANETPQQRFYMVGETYDFQNRGLIKSLIDSTNGLDGQFDFPLRIRIVESVLMRSTQNNLTPDDLSYSRNAPVGMQGLAQFMDSNDTFYPADAVMSTFIGNHDLPRSIHYAEDPSLWPDSSSPMKDVTWGDNAIADPPAIEADSNAYDRLANGFAVILTNKGAPLIYYGDEIGLPGAGDPDNRRMMPWTTLNADQQRLHDRIAALGTIRAKHAAMRRGVRTTLTSDADLWVYSITTPTGDPTPDTVYVGINRSDTDRTSTSIPGGLNELLTSTPSTATVTIPARQTRIWASP